MAYRLDLAAEVPDDDLRRCAREQLADAMHRLRGPDDPTTAIHETRKDLKKVRSLLRLARPCLPDDAYRRTNGRLRDIARALAGTRDDDVLAEVADAVAERHAGVVPASAFQALTAQLTANARATRTREAGAETDGTLADLEAAAADVARWPLGRCDADALGRGALRAYRRGRAAMELAKRDTTTENLHEWRKRVKDLWYHARLLEEAWPRAFKAQAKEAHALSDLLGDDHDLAALDTALDPGGPAADVPLDEAALRKVIALDRARLRAEAFELGRRLYAERPKDYRRRLLRYLRAAAAPEAAAT